MPTRPQELTCPRGGVSLGLRGASMTQRVPGRAVCELRSPLRGQP